GPIVPGARVRSLAEIADTVRSYQRHALEQSRIAREVQQLDASLRMLAADGEEHGTADAPLQRLRQERESRLDRAARKLLAQWPDMQRAYAGDEYVVKIRDKEIRTALTTPPWRG